MEVSNEIKEEIRKTQSDLKNAIKIHQVWVARLRDDQHNINLKAKIKDAEKDIVAIGQIQKNVVERLRHELELYQQRLKARNKQVNSDYDNRHIAQQLRDHQAQYRNKNKSLSLLKPSVLSEIHIKTDNNNVNGSRNRCHDKTELPLLPDSEHKNTVSVIKTKEEILDDDSEFIRATENFSLKGPNKVQERRANLANALNKARQTICVIPPGRRTPLKRSPSPPQPSPSPASSPAPTPSPPPLPAPGEPLTQESFLRAVGLVTPHLRQLMEKKRSERKKRSTTSTNKNEFVYGNFDMPPKRRKNNFPYLQQNVAPPQTRSQKMRRQQLAARAPGTTVTSPPASPPPWTPTNMTLPAGLTIEVVSPEPKVCTICRQNDVPSLLLYCLHCSCHFHSSCGSSPSRSPSSRSRSPHDKRGRRVLGCCPDCGHEVKEPTAPSVTVISEYNGVHADDLLKDKLLERKQLQERNKQLTAELRKLQAKSDSLKENLEAYNKEKKQLLSKGIDTQRNLQKILQVVGSFKGTSVSVESMSSTDKESSRSADEA